MTSATNDVEMATLERVRENFESKGYSFLIHPRPDQLPPFLDGHQPDALAVKALDKVIIEVAQKSSNQPRIPVAKLNQNVPPGSGWRYVLVYAGQDPNEMIELSRPQKSQIDEAIKEIYLLLNSGHNRAALNECWALLEALARRLYPEDFRISLRPLSPFQIVERLAMDGHLDDQEARRLRTLGSVRNAVVHGDLNISISPADLNEMIKKIEMINAQLVH